MHEEVHPEVFRRMAELAELHYEWSRRHAAAAELKRNSAGDYSVHHLDVDPPAGADDEFIRRAREIEGYDPDTGEYLG
ncbi:hypothetical protein [Cryptosporangium aurantiacum]|uniref:Uncharacterized protein n=1 Tax=Cryptosporangium aurantiacum TaxID=134849 RepID=A0A1M7NHB9_9ACTN|nr:hypothetical protein [Cryptosporangium aurantiacum]SHN03214.1 hypothetical protein SAMN05443668_102635 [Cryptosporangium aurantiacum]